MWVIMSNDEEYILSGYDKPINIKRGTPEYFDALDQWIFKPTSEVTIGDIKKFTYNSEEQANKDINGSIKHKSVIQFKDGREFNITESDNLKPVKFFMGMMKANELNL